MSSKEHEREMLKAATNKRYLEDLVKQARIKIKKSKIEDDKKELFIDSLSALRNYGSLHDATDEVLSYLEGICDGSYDLSGLHWVHDGCILFSHYEPFDAEDGEATHYKNKYHEIELKYSKKREPVSPHNLGNLSHFRESMEGIY